MKLIILFFIPTLLISQNKMSFNVIVDYSLEWQSDSLDVSSKTKTENFKLYISNNQTFFVSEHRIRLDTLIYNNASVGDLNQLMSLPKPSSNKRIFKTSKNIIVYDAFMTKVYKYEDDVDLNWKLINETDTINSLKVKKATTNFRGRDYIAWYSEEIPISDGPYKFKGLPGLIIKIFDTEKEINFSLVGFKKLNREKEIIVDYDIDAQNTTIENYYKAYYSFLENPIPHLESQGMVFDEKTKRIIRQRYRERNNKANNKIELK
ncbi:GLPGLI family protein [Psychroflexus sp. MBR-150]|jgi:GLPGLI family protein